MICILKVKKITIYIYNANDKIVVSKQGCKICLLRVVFLQIYNTLLLYLQTSYRVGEYIVRQGAGGDTFFIISKGRVSCVLN